MIKSMKKEKTVDALELVAEMLKICGELGYMITSQIVNQVRQEGVAQ